MLTSHFVELIRQSEDSFNFTLRQEFKSLIINECTFVDNWEHPSVRGNIARLLHSKEAQRAVEEKQLDLIKHEHPDCFRSRESEDCYTFPGNCWVRASAGTSRALNRNTLVKEPPVVHFYPHAVYSITFTRPGDFYESQLAVLADVPAVEAIYEFQPVSVYVAPPTMSVGRIPSNLTTEADYLNSGFEKQQIGVAPERIITEERIVLGDIRAKRRQYGLRHDLAATFQQSLGRFFPSFATQVTGSSMYRLQSKEQMMALFLRTECTRDIIFVGDSEDTAEALTQLLDGADPTAVSPAPDRFRPCDYTIPNDGAGFVFVLVSAQDQCTMQIGECANLHMCLHEKNRTSNRSAISCGLHPWKLLAYVMGFERNGRSERIQFKQLWQATQDRTNAQRRRRDMAALTASEVADLGRKLVAQRLYTSLSALKNVQLTFVQCGTFALLSD